MATADGAGMNLGQLLGQQKLRIWQLEDELAGHPYTSWEPSTMPATSSAPIDPEAAPSPLLRLVEAPPPARRGINRGVGARVHAALPAEPPGLNISELAARLVDVPHHTISSFLCQFDDIAHTGEWRHYRYYRKAAG